MRSSGWCGREETGENAPGSWNTCMGANSARLRGKRETASKVDCSRSVSEVDAVFPLIPNSIYAITIKNRLLKVSQQSACVSICMAKLLSAFLHQIAYINLHQGQKHFHPIPYDLDYLNYIFLEHQPSLYALHS